MTDLVGLDQQRGMLAAITLTAVAEVIPGDPDQPADEAAEQEDR